jgi:tight adherence protein C
MVLNQILLILGMLAGGLCVYFVASSFFGSLLSKNNSTSLVWGESADLPKQSRSPIITLTRPLVHKVAIPLLSRYKLEEYKKGIKRNIYAAGLGQELNEDEYIGLQLLMGILLPVFVSMTNVLFNLEYPWLVIVLFGVMGFAFPHFYVKGHKAQRTAQVLLQEVHSRIHSTMDSR